MKFNFKSLLLNLILINTFSMNQVRVILTTALTEAHYEFRKQQYIHAFNMLRSFGCTDFYIIEAVAKKGPTFLDEHCSNVFYASVNDQNCKNQGVNESRTILEALQFFNFDPEDMIIKLTGRHCLISDYFIKMVESHSGCDAIFTYCDGRLPEFTNGMIPTFCFAMKCKHLYQMYLDIDYSLMQSCNVPIEWVVADFIANQKNEHNFKLLVLDKLDISINAYASSASPGLPEHVMYF